MRVRDLQEEDLEPLFKIQNDPESRWMAGFGSKDFSDRAAFMQRMSKISKDEDSIYKVVEYNLQVVGNVGKWVYEEKPELMYEIDKRFRGIGLASAAVREFLLQFAQRPLYAHTTADNLPSQAILRKLGFSKYEELLSFSSIRNMEVLEIGFVLN